MILHQAEVEQTVDREERHRFVKELVVARVRSTAVEIGPAGRGVQGARARTQDGGAERGAHEVPLAMVRKRSVALGGTAAPVLLIHGYGQNRYTWHLPARSFSNYLARAGFDVFNLDLRGHGRSRHLGARRPGHVNDFVREDIPAAVDEVRRLSGGRAVYLIGHSLGGMVSYAAAPALGGAVAGVVTLGSPYLFTRGSWPLTVLGELMLGLDRRIPLGRGAVALGPWAEAARLARVFIESPIFPLPIRGFVPGSMEPAVLSQHMSLAMDSGSIAVLRNMFLDAAACRKSGHRLGSLFGYASRFEALDLPLLMIAGSRDDLAPPASVKPGFELSRSSDKTYREVARGHLDILVGREAPLTVWPLVEAWLKARCERAAALRMTC